MADVITLLEHDHREVEELFEKIKKTNGAARASSSRGSPPTCGST